MMHKKVQCEFQGKYYKYYDLDSSVRALLETVKKAGLDNLSVCISVGEGFGEPGYPIEDVLRNYDAFMADISDPAAVKLRCSGSVSGTKITILIKPAEREVSLTTPDNDLELPDILAGKAHPGEPQSAHPAVSKMFQSEFDGEIYKYYDFDAKNYSVPDLLRDIQRVKLNGYILRVQEDADGEMQSISGSYSFDDLIDNYDEYMAEALYPSSVKISCAGDYRGNEIIMTISVGNKSVTLITENDDLELDVILADQPQPEAEPEPVPEPKTVSVEKSFQSKLGDKIYKYYTLSDADTAKDLLGSIRQLHLKNLLEDVLVNVNEDADGEMQSIAGAYALDDLFEHYDEYMSEALYPSAVSIHCRSMWKGSRISILLKPSENSVTFITKNDDLELDEILSQHT